MTMLRTGSVRPTVAALALAAAVFSPLANATPDAKASAEIDQLLTAIQKSNCTFVRSGQEYDGSAARKHLEFKLGFVRSRLDTADQFVEKLASASSTTGEAYHIRCSGNDNLARTWLDAQLKVIRGQH